MNMQRKIQGRTITFSAFVLPYFALIILIIFASIISPGFAAPDHLLLILNTAAFLGLAAAGQSLVIMTGGIDLSVSSVITFSGVLASTLMNGSNENMAFALFAGLGLGLTVGLINGIGVAYINIHPMVMTLGMTSIVQGSALLYTNGAPKGRTAPLLAQLATGRLFGFFPIMLIIWFCIAAVLIVLMHKSIWGRCLYALGNSPKATYYSGIRVQWMLVGLYACSGLLAASAGIFLTGYTQTSYLTIGESYQMDSIAATVIGGASIMGGSGSYAGTIAGCIIMILLQAILPVLAIPEAGRRIFLGLLILCLLLLYGRGKKLQH